MDNVNALSDAQINAYQKALTDELNRRLRVEAIPRQIHDLVQDARAGGELSDTQIREAFEDAMNTDID